MPLKKQLFIVLKFGIYWARRLIVSRKEPGAEHRLKRGMGAQKAYYIASVLAFAPVTLLAMQAYSQLQFTDIALVVILLAIVTFYIIKRR